MNLFILDASPALAATYLCDQHLAKMLLETAQILCDVALDLGQPAAEVPYRHTRGNQLPQRWVAASFENWRWALCYGLCLGHRRHVAECAVHKSEIVFIRCKNGDLWRPQPSTLTPFPKTWAGDPVLWYPDDPVRSHRLYYARKRQHWAERGKAMTWTNPGVEVPCSQ